jgi:hypothetical protein
MSIFFIYGDSGQLPGGLLSLADSPMTDSISMDLMASWSLLCA